MPHEDGFNNAKNSCFKIRYYNVCDDYGVNVGEIWMDGDGFIQRSFSNYRKTAKMEFLAIIERLQKCLFKATLQDI